MNENEPILTTDQDILDIIQVMSQLDTQKKQDILAAIDTISTDSSENPNTSIP